MVAWFRVQQTRSQLYFKKMGKFFSYRLIDFSHFLLSIAPCPFCPISFRAQIDALQKANATLTASAAALDRELSERTADGVRLRESVHALESCAQDAKAAADALQVWQIQQSHTLPLRRLGFDGAANDVI
jgi:hypothetical protein